MMKGIDISYWQGDINFSKVKSSGIDFAILRSSYRKTADPKFYEYVNGCKKNNIPIIGTYHFIYALNERDALNEAKFCVDVIRKAGLDKNTIIFADFEYDTIKKAAEKGVRLGKNECNNFTRIFCEYVESQGFKAGIYANIDYNRNWYNQDLIKKYVFWLADYTGKADYDCVLHQYTSSGKVNGINGDVDMNYYYGKMEDSKVGVTAQDVLNVMRSWLGYSEANGKYMTILNIYNSHKPLARGYAIKPNDEWCDATVSAAAIKAGAVELVGTEVGCEEHVNIFRRKGIWIEDGTIVPEPGDIILYNWDDKTQPNNGYSDHIGYVEKVTNGKIIAIEGNRGEAVARREIPVGWGMIRGFARPKYAKTSQSTNKPSSKPSENTNTDNRRKRLFVGKVTASVLNVRSWAGEEYPNIKSYPKLNKGNLVDVMDYTQKDNDGDDWYYIRIKNKYYGFVHSDYIERQ
nr:GH25 family lysozyme [uncultured Blautia sp.]